MYRKNNLIKRLTTDFTDFTDKRFFSRQVAKTPDGRGSAGSRICDLNAACPGQPLDKGSRKNNFRTGGVIQTFQREGGVRKMGSEKWKACAWLQAGGRGVLYF
jgi:hypothetical protein